MEVEEDQENLAGLPMVTSRWDTGAGDTNQEEEPASNLEPELRSDTS